ncbi:hypothetical protein ACHAW6_011499 [Cyclotella cf. meneghiniana]
MASSDLSSPYGTITGTALDVVIVVPSKQLPICTETSTERNTAQNEGVIACSDFYVTFPLSLQCGTAKNANTFSSLNSSTAKIRRWTSFYNNDCNSTSHPTLDEALQNAGRAILKKGDSDHSIDYSVSMKDAINTPNKEYENQSSTMHLKSNSPKRGNVQIQINGRHIPDFEMNFGVNKSCEKACKFVDGNGLRPPTEALERLTGKGFEEKNADMMEITEPQQYNRKSAILNYGRNLIRYILFGEQGDIMATTEAFLYLWSACDSVIVCDVDGTITKSDVRGVIDTVVQEKFSHIHRGVCKFFNELVNVPGENSGEVRLLYLSSRPISYIAQTRKLLVGLSQEDEEFASQRSAVTSIKRFCLPPGPIICHRGSLSTVLHSELVAKNISEFKADVLVRQIILPFVAAVGDAGRHQIRAQALIDSLSDSNILNSKREGSKVTIDNDVDNRIFLGGFGNKNSDAKAYELAGMERRDIYIINKESHIKCLGDEESIRSVSAKSLDNSECPIPDLCCAGEKYSNVFRDESQELDVAQCDAIEASLSEREQGQNTSENSRTIVDIQYVKPIAQRKNSGRKTAKQTIRAFSSRRSFASFPSFGSGGSGFYGYDDPNLLLAVKERMERNVSN